MMAKTGILIISNPQKYKKCIPRLMSEIKNTLYIHFYPDRQTVLCPKTTHPSVYSTSIINFYKHSLHMRHIDVRVLLSGLKNPSLTRISTLKPIEVVFFDDSINRDEIQCFISSCILNKTKDCHAVSISDSEDPVENVNSDDSPSVNYVVLGGTFDRLHIGHKILLSEAVLRCKKKLTVGVTDTNMLKSKKLWELVEPCSIRMSKVQDFLKDVEPTLEYDVISIKDVYGPTKDEPSFELLVVSAETMGGGNKINEARLRNGLHPLKVHSVELIPDEKFEEEEEDKVSSSNDRLRILGTVLSPPEPKPHLSSLPYMIGLTGGIASGKSSLSQRLSKLGAKIIDCDMVAHSLYKKGSSLHSNILDTFGRDLMDEAGEINRQKLGKIVFNNKEKLGVLNRLLWPCILERSKEMAMESYNEGSKVVILEAAVLIQADWCSQLHEIWAAIIPPEEAVRRMKNRNKMTEEEAQSRLSSQPTNVEFVSKANVVFCTLWREEFSQKQVEKAWTSLLERLPS